LSKRLLATLAKAAGASSAAAARRVHLRHAGFWVKVRVAVLTATLAAVAAADVALAATSTRATPTSGAATPYCPT
jgi:hypothetical protein